MKTILSLILLLISSLTLTGQCKLDLTFYLLGHASDYLGRNKNNIDWVETYYPHEKPLVNYLDSLIKAEIATGNRLTYKFGTPQRIDCSNCHMFTELVSKQLAQKLNSFYRFKNIDGLGPTGTLKKNQIKTETESLSFLAGVFARHGDVENGVFTIHLPNSPTKKDVVLKLLKSLQCEKVDLTQTNTIPTDYVITFSPSARVRECLATQFALIAKLKESLNTVHH